MLIEEYAVGAESGRTALSHEGEECAVVIEGRLEVTVSGQSRILGPGDAYYFSSLLPHRFPQCRENKLQGYQRLHSFLILNDFDKAARIAVRPSG